MSTSEGSPSTTDKGQGFDRNGFPIDADPEGHPWGVWTSYRAPNQTDQHSWHVHGKPPLRPEGVAKFGFEGEPPEGWSTEERRSLADWRHREQIEEGAPEPISFPWGVLFLSLAFVLAVVGCIGGSIWALVS